jgi:hypothetical protein
MVVPTPQYRAFRFLFSLPPTFHEFHLITLAPIQHNSVHPTCQRFPDLTLVSAGEFTYTVCSRPITEFFAVTSQVGIIRRPDSGTKLKLNLIQFWPGHADPDSDNIEFGPGCYCQHPDRILNLAAGASGTYVLSVRQEKPYLEPYLGLVHFSPLPVPHTTFRKLDTGDVTLSSCREIFLDDSLGLVAILDDEGQVTTISYL